MKNEKKIGARKVRGRLKPRYGADGHFRQSLDPSVSSIQISLLISGSMNNFSDWSLDFLTGFIDWVQHMRFKSDI